MPDSGTADPSIFKNQNYDPFQFQNKLLDNQQKQQEVEAGQLGLAMKRFQTINSASSGLLEDPDLGKTDIRKKLWDTLARATAGDGMTAQQAVEFATKFPEDPQQQYQAIKAVHAHTLDAMQKGNAYLGQVSGQDTGANINYNRQTTWGAPQETGISYPKTVPPTTEQVNPDLSKSYTGGAGNPGLQTRTMPPANGAPARAKVPSTNRLIGDDEAQKTGLYPAAPVAPPPPVQRVNSQRSPDGRGYRPSGAPGTIVAAPSPGAAAPLAESGLAYGKDLADSRNYSTRMTPLREAIPLIEKTKTGPGQEVFQKIGAVAQTLGFPIPNPDQITNYAKAQKYFAQNAAAAAPPGTNIPSVMNAFEANPNLSQPNQAASDLSKMLYGLGRLKQASVIAFKKTGLPPEKYTDWASTWSTEQDPRAYMADLMTPEQREKLKKTIKPGTDQAAKFRKSFDDAKEMKLLGDVEGHEMK